MSGRPGIGWRFIVLMAMAVGTFVSYSGTARAESPGGKPSSDVAKSDSVKTDDTRKLKVKVAPVYPELARRMHVGGTVRVVIVIAPGGTVKIVKPVGGHPLLLESAMEAVKRWRYEPASQETTTMIEFKFSEQGS